MTSSQLSVLQLLSTGPKAAPELTDEQIETIKRLIGYGLVYDYADFWKRRTPTHLRIWGLTQAGKAALHNSAIVKDVTRKAFLLPLETPKPRPSASTHKQRKEPQNES